MAKNNNHQRNSTITNVGRKRTSERSEFLCVYANEWDKYAAKIYEKNFGERPDTRDITTVGADEIPDHDLLTVGFPCQAFSIAGKRKGFNDTRGTLFFEIGRILRHKKPGYFILENVKGLLSHDEGRTFEIIIISLNELGYDVQWQVHNSKNWVPQSRERMFIIGHIRGERRPEIFPFREGNSQNDKMEKQYIAKTIKAGDYKLPGDLQLISYAIDSNYYKGTSYRDFKEKHRRQLIVRDGRDNRSCLRSGRTPEIGIKGLSIRRLTPIECERIQGFPDNWTEGVSDRQRYICLGNAVTTNVITEIGKRLLSETK